MKRCFQLIYLLVWISFLTIGCKNNIKQQEDEIYSRHLQTHIKLTIISTPAPTDKSKINLLLLNDGQDVASLRIKEIIDSLYEKESIQPLVIVAVHANERMQEYGVIGKPDFNNNGSRADKYASFIENELYDFAKKRAGVRKFNSVALAGCSLGGLSAFDIAWTNADKIDKVGVFSGSFWWRDKDANAVDYSDKENRIMLKKIKSSRKKPHLKYWFYSGGKEEDGDRDNDGIIDVVDDTKDLIDIIKSKNVGSASDITYKEIPGGKHDYASWSHALPAFLIWAFER